MRTEKTEFSETLGDRFFKTPKKDYKENITKQTDVQEEKGENCT